MSQQQTDERKMCELHAAGLMEEIDQRTNNPQFICGKCQRKADRAEHLHNPHPIDKKTGDNFWS